MSAWINGFLGVALCFGVGMGVLGLDPETILRSIGASLLSGLFSVLTLLTAERQPTLKQTLLKNSLRTWAIFLTLYFGPLLALSPILREMRVFGWMVLPLILCTGFSILVFGPIQDRIIARLQRKARQV